MTKKYSIIIPTRNGVDYLPYAIESILSQKHHSFELIISDNYSTDSTWEYLLSIQDSRIRILRPPQALSMAKHFEFAISLASGEWISILGDDDAVQPYFFDLAEKLTVNADVGVEVVSSARAYFNWPGCEKIHGNTVVNYVSSQKIETRLTSWRLIKYLINDGHYFDEPQFYTGNLFRRSLVERIIADQGGALFSTSIVDANSVALIFKYVSRYIYCFTPLAWVGSSPKSTGFSYTTYLSVEMSEKQSAKVRIDDFEALNKENPTRDSIRFPNILETGDTNLFFIDALDKVYSLSSSWQRRILLFKPLLYVVAAKVYQTYLNNCGNYRVRNAYHLFFETNQLHEPIIRIIYSIRYRCKRLVSKVRRYLITNDGPCGVAEFKHSGAFLSKSSSDFPTIREAGKVSNELYKDVGSQSSKSGESISIKN